MILPSARLWYEGQSKELEAILQEAANFHLNGYVRCAFNNGQNFILLEHGEIKEVIDIGPADIPSSKNIRDLWGKSKIKNGLLQVFEIPPEIFYLLNRINDRKLVIEKGNRPKKLKEIILSLRQSAETKIVDIATEEGKGLLVFENKAITYCFFSENEGFTLSGPAAFRKLASKLKKGSDFQAWSSNLNSLEPKKYPWLPILLESAGYLSSSTHLRQYLKDKFGTLYRTDKVLFKEGDPGGEIFLIISGKVRVYRERKGLRIILAELGAGEIIGEMSFFNQCNRSATAQTIEDSLIFKIGSEEFQTLLYNSPEFRINMVKKLIQRLRITTGEISRYWEEPRSTYLEKIIVQIINSSNLWLEKGIPPGLLMQEISNFSKMRFSEIDEIFRKLLENRRIEFIDGKVILKDPVHLP